MTIIDQIYGFGRDLENKNENEIICVEQKVIS